MKTFLSALVTVSTFGVMQAGAVVYFNEPFSYPDGSLTTVSGDWSTHSGTAGQIQVISESITLMDSQSEDVNRPLGATVTTGSVFGAFDFSVTAGAPVGGTDFEYFAHFGNGTSDFTARMDVVAPSGGGDFSVGISATSTAQATWATDLSFGVTYQAVIGYNRDSGIPTLWIDPASEASTSISGFADTNDVEGFYFRQSNSSANETIVIDNLTVASTFNEATGIPEPAGFALVGLGGILLVLRRRR